ncbi:HEAT repeat domain-containing protein [Gimesia panareensis]|uniref:HEAT repeat domain-containing protein n=1 Tax=Gimesia panareensis TaxID=2527978 RepID=UPI0011877544|nr:HEAT repeat domain-containing protein [Gimesia panareensis]QDU53154.1 HEAT repeat protein [Gimesia panareensis]
MASSITKTFDLLAQSRNSNAINALILALDVDDDLIREQAVFALLQQQSARGLVEVIRRYATHSPAIRKLLETHSKALDAAIRQCLLHGNRELQYCGIEFVRLNHDFRQIPALIDLFENKRLVNHQPDMATQTLRHLIGQLYEHFLDRSVDSVYSRSFLKNAKAIRREILSSLMKASEHLQEFDRPEEIMESLLILGNVDDAAIRKILWHSDPETRRLAEQVLRESKHVGVMQLICDFTGVSYPNTKALEALAERQDPEFIAHLLRWLPEHPSELQQTNFRQIGKIVWLDVEQQDFTKIPPVLQTAVIRLISLLELDLPSKKHAQRWMLQHGTPAAKEAAISILRNPDPTEVAEMVLENLDSEDPVQQAWATCQLRAQHVPDAMNLLIEKIDSPIEEVREAARKELASFDVDFVLEHFEGFNPQVCPSVGKLLLKLDPRCLLELSRAMAHPLKKRRIKAARCAQVLELHGELIPALAALTEDSDDLVRRTSAEILGTLSVPAARQALMPLLTDENTRVREVAVKILRVPEKTDSTAVSPESEKEE